MNKPRGWSQYGSSETLEKGTDMKIKQFTLQQSKTDFQTAKAVVNNKTAATSEQIIANLSQVLFEMFQQEKVKQNE